MHRAAVRRAIGYVAAAATISAGGVLLASPAAAGTAPSTPTDVHVVASTDTTLTVSWSPSTSAAGISTYTLRAYPPNSNGLWIFGGNPTGTTHTITGLSPSTTYTITVQANGNDYTHSPESAPTPGTTAADVSAPTTPTGLTVAAQTPATIQFTWTAARDDVKVAAYRVLDNGQLASTGGVGTYLRNLTAGSTHTFTVQALDAAGNASAVSDALTVHQPAKTDTQAPSVPSSLQVDINGTDIDLDWQGSTDNVDAAGQLDYEIFVDGVFVTFAHGVVSTVLFGVSLETSHSYAVRAVDGSGNASAPSPATVM